MSTPVQDGQQAAVELVQTKKAFEGLEAALFDQMMRTEAEETARRDSLFFAIKALRGARAALMLASQSQDIENYAQFLAAEGFTAPLP